ncbi:hypothetical protein AVEN_14424-1 [Araneus ventricosus]|uniref:Uncharacterized protein n=1 Tax=Araneus ventricosus TaxID=182803 RepID=A0A4Y2GAQ2_ARAVE|nr:hypothetical protein AVEN_14424-1 [Araneus ventricosus]
MFKLLVHGEAMISHTVLPIRQLSEEEAETRYKHFRLHRTKYALKFFREHCNMDIFNSLLLICDTFLSSFREITKKNYVFGKKSCTYAVEMLVSCQTAATSEDSVVEEISENGISEEEDDIGEEESIQE